MEKHCEVKLIEVLGTDLTVVNAARVSMDKCKDDFDEKDYKLLKYLIKHDHWTPFSHPQLQFRLTMPIFVARQWFKHQIGFSRNEVSRRYVSSAPQFYSPSELRQVAPNVKQGSSDEVVEKNELLIQMYEYAVSECTTVYTAMLANGVCPEQARMVLPQSMMTSFYETGSLQAYLRLCKLRNDSHAQKEIRLFSLEVYAILKTVFPETLRAWEELNG